MGFYTISDKLIKNRINSFISMSKSSLAITSTHYQVALVVRRSSFTPSSNVNRTNLFGFLFFLAPIVLVYSHSCPTKSDPTLNPRFLNSTTDRRAFIRHIALEAWGTYTKYAWGQDGVRSVNGSIDFAVHTFDQSGRSIMAAMPTLWIMGFHSEFEHGRSWIETRLKIGQLNSTHLTEEYLGSLLACYALTGDLLFKQKALEIGLEITNSGMPNNFKNTNEFAYLLAIEKQVNPWKQTDVRLKRSSSNGSSVEQTDHYVEQVVRNAKLLHQSYGHSSTSITKLNSLIIDGSLSGRIGFLVNPGWMYLNRSTWRFMCYSDCQLGSAFALFAHNIRFDGVNKSDIETISGFNKTKRKLFNLAKGMTEVCHAMTLATPNRLPKKTFYIEENKTNTAESFYVLPVIDAEPYQLEAELLEAYLTLFQLTGDQKYRDYAWEFTVALYENSRTKEGAYFGETENGFQQKLQPPVFFSGTLKYLYLIFSNNWIIPLDKWVFNAAGHPLPVYGQNAAFPIKN